MDTTITPGPIEEPPQKGFIERYHQDLRQAIKQALSSPVSEREERMQDIEDQFIAACKRGNPETVKIFIEYGIDVNARHPLTGASALHLAAATKARAIIRLLLATDQCDYLQRDHEGRLASEYAFLFGYDPALARLLGNKERKQAEAQGVKLTRRP